MHTVTLFNAARKSSAQSVQLCQPDQSQRDAGVENTCSAFIRPKMDPALKAAQ